MPTKSTCAAAAAVIASLALPCGGASAQRIVQASSAAPRSKDHVTLGIGVAHLPSYQGASTYRSLPIPVVDIAKGRFFANIRNGVGITVLDGRVITLGASIAPVSGFRPRDVPNGLDRPDFGAGGRLFLSLNLGPVVATIGATHAFVGGTGGTVADASLSHPVVVSPKVVLIPSLGVTWADRRHNDRYFGVTGSQSLASGLAPFAAGRGLKDATAGLAANYRLSPAINLTAAGSLTTLLSEVRRSPLVKRRTQPSLFLSTTYGF